MEQPVTRRTFFQFTLALACAGQVEAAGSVALRGHFRARLQGDNLLISLRVYNDGGQPVDVLAKRGVASAIEVHAAWGSWQAQTSPDPDTEFRTRAGPRLVWQPVAARTSWEAGTFELKLPQGSRADLLNQPAALRATLRTHQGVTVLQKDGVTVAADP